MSLIIDQDDAGIRIGVNVIAMKSPISMFRKAAGFEAFERVMVEAHQREPIRILAYCMLSNHWHFVVWPERDGQLSDFFRWLAEFG